MKVRALDEITLLVADDPDLDRPFRVWHAAVQFGLFWDIRTPLFVKQSLPIRGYAAGWAWHGLI